MRRRVKEEIRQGRWRELGLGPSTAISCYCFPTGNA